MPQISGDTYLPLNAAQKTEAANYMQNLIRMGGMTDKEIVEAALRRIPGTDQYDLLPMYSIERSAQRSVDAGEALRNDPTHVPGPGEIPTTPRQPEERGQYIYDVVITAIDPVTGDRYTNREEMVMNSPMSAAEIEAYVQQHLDQFIYIPNSPFPPQGFRGTPEVSAMILDVGRGG